MRHVPVPPRRKTQIDTCTNFFSVDVGLAGCLLLLLLFFADNVIAAANGCPAPDPAGKNYTGQDLTDHNFANANLDKANFTGAKLNGAVFIGASLKGAVFSGATLNASSNGLADFSLADLTNACFSGAQLEGARFQYAGLKGTKFIGADISSASFGPEIKASTDPKSRTTFAKTTMNCEFIDQWKLLDLTGAKVMACASQLKGVDFSGAQMAKVDLTGAVLDGVKFIKANLTEAILNQVSLQCLTLADGSQQCADLQEATLFGAQIKRANLTGANLYHAFLSNDTGGNISNSASLRKSHLKNVNLSFAQLSGVDFQYANFYGDNPAGQNSCATTSRNYQGFTKSCASAHSATMVATNFSNAYLYGVDFTSTQVTGVKFPNAVLTGANFAASVFQPDSNSGAAPDFSQAFLQGANLTGVAIRNCTEPGCIPFTDAFLDFRSQGNNIYILLDGTDHNNFAGCPSSGGGNNKPPCGQSVCVWVRYGKPSTVPVDSNYLTCPDYSTKGCGTSGSKGWESTLNIGLKNLGVPSAWYSNNATYTKALPSTSMDICGGKGDSARVLFW